MQNLKKNHTFLLPYVLTFELRKKEKRKQSQIVSLAILSLIKRDNKKIYDEIKRKCQESDDIQMLGLFAHIELSEEAKKPIAFGEEKKR